ncbi:MAG: flagellar M-ring protein FliF C-terminal domain-containing protein [Phycisphaerae bacterium]
MEFLRKLVLQTQEHLKGLTPSQRLAIGSCGALIVVSLLWLVQWGSQAELVPLLDQPITAAELAPIEQRLSALGIEHKVVGEVVMVPAEKRARLLAQLTESQALPKDISIGLDKLINDNNVWVSQEQQAWRRTVALSNELSKILREFSGVQEARVLLDRAMKRTVTGPPITPTASVFVKLAPGETLTKERTFAIASLVSRAVAGLDISNVAVTDARTNRSMSVPSKDDASAFGADELELLAKKEEHYARKIRDLLANIPGLLVEVRAELDPENRKETRQEYSKPYAVTDETESTIQDRSVQAGGPGVVPNTAKVIGSTGPIDRMEKNTNKATYETKTTAIVTTESLRHGIKRLSASVNVPRSYLAAIFRNANNGKEPSDAELKTAAQEELEKIAEMVRTVLAVKDDADAVAVQWFHDDALAPAGIAMSETPIGGDLFTFMRLYGGKAGVVALGALSLLMMLMMVRKVGEGPVLPGEEPPKLFGRSAGKKGKNQEEGEEETDQSTLVMGVPPVGEAALQEHLLVGREVDESTLRIQQVVEQIGNMVKDDPKASAEILQRWIEAEKP